MRRYVNETQAAHFLGVSRSYLLKRRQKGHPEGPPHAVIGRLIRYDLQALEAWVREREVTPEARPRSAAQRRRDRRNAMS